LVLANCCFWLRQLLWLLCFCNKLCTEVTFISLKNCFTFMFYLLTSLLHILIILNTSGTCINCNIQTVARWLFGLNDERFRETLNCTNDLIHLVISGHGL
jgi:hypothetical protein